MQTLSQTRQAFLDFFGKHGHAVLPSSALVPQSDPTLMFTNAGMVPFKNIFTGAEKPPSPRAATSQKCVRAGGKHNDLDNVGYTARHHTFFEMLGNFSFGDYFKEEAIKLAWDLITKEYGLDKNRLMATVYHTDDEAFDLWKKISGLPESKIIRIPTNDNFWAMGDTGPCGPCSEIFYDHGDHIPGGPPGSADADGDRFVEIWNLVFMQYEQVDAEKRIELPKPSIDTGMGLERITAVMQGVSDNYDIDLFKNLINAIKEEVGVRPGGQGRAEGAQTDLKSASGRTEFSGSNSKTAPYKVIADHLRASSFLIADGVLPSNEGRGYVLRRIMRRAMRYAHQLGCKDPLMHRLVPSLIAEMGDHYPELKRAESLTTETLRSEEEQFKRTLERGLKLLEEETTSLTKGGTLKGDVAFKLYDTYGFPLDLTQDILKSRGIGVDTAAFDAAMEKQKDMARAAWTGSGEKATGKIWFELKEKVGATKFLGYDQDEADATIRAIVKDNAPVDAAAPGDEVYLVLDQTPFYGESGGQIGDTGTFTSGKDVLAEIGDTQKPLDDFHIHRAKMLKPVKLGDTIHVVVDASRRNATRANHSATHLLHKALRDALGEHVTQKGSLVAPDKLRFDFSHPKAVAREEMAAIEQKVNEVIWRNTPVGCKVMAPDDAIKAGAMALFGEKYGDEVRVLSMGEIDARTERSREPSASEAASHGGGQEAGAGDIQKIPYSVELCGGTHVARTGDIGLFKVVSEGSVASGIRRIEAVTGENVRQYFKDMLSKQDEQLQKLHAENVRLKAELSKPAPAPAPAFSPAMLDNAALKDLFALYEKQSGEQLDHILSLQEENKKLGKELAAAKKSSAMGDMADVNKETLGKITLLSKIFDDLPPKDLRGVAGELIAPSSIVAVATGFEGKASIVIAVSKDLTAIYDAAALVREAAAAVGGKGGGGKPDMAQAGGPDADKLGAAIELIRSKIQQVTA